MVDVIGRLQEAVDASGMKRVRIAADAAMPATKLSKILNRKQEPTISELLAICGAIRLEPVRLFIDADVFVDVETVRSALNMSRDVQAATERLTQLLANLLPDAQTRAKSSSSFKPLPSHDVKPVPAAANPNAELIGEFEKESKQIPMRIWLRGARIIARAVGESMNGGADPIRSGELVYLAKTRDWRKVLNKVVLIRRGDALFLKKFEKRGRMIYLVSENGAAAIEINADAEKDNLQVFGYMIDHAAD